MTFTATSYLIRAPVSQTKTNGHVIHSMLERKKKAHLNTHCSQKNSSYIEKEKSYEVKERCAGELIRTEEKNDRHANIIQLQLHQSMAVTDVTEVDQPNGPKTDY